MTAPNDEFELTRPSQPRTHTSGLAADSLVHYLVLTREDGPPERIEIGNEPLSIGRDVRQGLVLSGTEVSRSHARIYLEQGDAIVEDLQSTNGSFLNGRRLTGPAKLQNGSVLRFGKHLLKYEHRNRADVERARELERELARARSYVLSLLPNALTKGPVLADWRFLPSTQLGGDALGYDWLDPDTFVFYLLDVSGHGVGAAMHSVAVLNVLRQRALPHVDFGDPASVLGSLNARFQMDSHHGMFFTIWYGVYRPATRTLSFASAGHHEAYLVPDTRDRIEGLGAPALMIGALPEATYEVRHATVPTASRLYLFSDGVFEIAASDGKRWELSDFLPLLREAPSPGVPESARLLDEARRHTASGHFDDDASLLVLTFA